MFNEFNLGSQFKFESAQLSWRYEEKTNAHFTPCPRSESVYI